MQNLNRLIEILQTTVPVYGQLNYSSVEVLHEFLTTVIGSIAVHLIVTHGI